MKQDSDLEMIVLEIIVEIADAKTGAVLGNTHLVGELGLDSLDLAELTEAVSERFTIEFSQEELELGAIFQTPTTLTEAIRSHL